MESAGGEPWVNQMWTPQKLKDGSATHYGMGWGIGEYRGSRSVQHSGSRPGVGTLLWLWPKRECAVVLLANLGEAQLQALAHRLAIAPARTDHPRQV